MKENIGPKPSFTEQVKNLVTQDEITTPEAIKRINNLRIIKGERPARIFTTEEIKNLIEKHSQL